MPHYIFGTNKYDWLVTANGCHTDHRSHKKKNRIEIRYSKTTNSYLQLLKEHAEAVFYLSYLFKFIQKEYSLFLEAWKESQPTSQPHKRYKTLLLKVTFTLLVLKPMLSRA